MPPSPQASNRTNLLELSARVQSVEAKLDTIMKMLSSMGAKGGRARDKSTRRCDGH